MLIAKSSEKTFIMEKSIASALHIAVLALSLQQNKEYSIYDIYNNNEVIATIEINADSINVINSSINAEDIEDAIYDVQHIDEVAVNKNSMPTWKQYNWHAEPITP